MKTLKKFIEECGNPSKAAKTLNHPQQTVDRWSKSNKEFFVKKKGKEYQVLEVK